MKLWDCFCLTSKHEGLGLVLLEAIYAEIPIIAMDVSSISETIGPCGETTPFGEIELFADKIDYIIKNKNKYIHPEYLDKYDIKENSRLHHKIYQSVI